MKTYAETQGEKPFDWNAFLDSAIENEPDEEAWEEANDLAGKWVTCACGNQCADIPRDETDGLPDDGILVKLGMNFWNEIQDKEWEWAIHFLAQIEARSAEILAEMKKEQS